MTKQRKYTIDRIENNIAVLLCRDDETVKYDIPVEQLPPGVAEGDILAAIIDNGIVMSAKVLKKETEKQKIIVEDKIQRLLNKNR